MIESVAGPQAWAAFIAFILILLALDLGVFHRKAHAIGFREAVAWSTVWIGLAVAFNLGVWKWMGPERGLEFTAGYLIEKALSVDNVFVFLVIFATFRVPPALQHRVLFWGVVGALVLRAIFIVAGAAALERFHGLIYVFGAILLFTGIKLLLQRDHDEHPERNPLYRIFMRFVPSSGRYDGARFFIRENGRRLATPLFAVLVLVELTDVVFAIDSIPAIFAVTQDPFIVFSSNIFAILGLRALYFCIAGFIDRLRYLKVGLALVLIFVAGKMLVSDFYKVPIGVSLGAVSVLLGGATVASLIATRRQTSATTIDGPGSTKGQSGGDPNVLQEHA